MFLLIFNLGIRGRSVTLLLFCGPSQLILLCPLQCLETKVLLGVTIDLTPIKKKKKVEMFLKKNIFYFLNCLLKILKKRLLTNEAHATGLPNLHH